MRRDNPIRKSTVIIVIINLGRANLNFLAIKISNTVFTAKLLANNWIKKSGIASYFKETEQIYYEPTRELKVKRIRELALNYFVDDLEEIFKESEFPVNTKSFLIYKNRTQIFLLLSYF